jgi:hypothetical protein
VTGLVVDVEDVVDEVVSDVDRVVVGDALVEGGETGVAGETVVGVCGLGPVVVVVEVVVVVGAAPVSAETQPEGGDEAPIWPGIRTVPAHPKFEKWASSVTVPPSEKATVDADSRMKPEASMETRSLMVR